MKRFGNSSVFEVNRLYPAGVYTGNKVMMTENEYIHIINITSMSAMILNSVFFTG